MRYRNSAIWLAKDVLLLKWVRNKSDKTKAALASALTVCLGVGRFGSAALPVSLFMWAAGMYSEILSSLFNLNSAIFSIFFHPIWSDLGILRKPYNCFVPFRVFIPQIGLQAPEVAYGHNSFTYFLWNFQLKGEYWCSTVFE